MNDFILGPQVPIGDNYFDQTFLAKARQHGLACPTTAPPQPLEPVEPQRQDFGSDADFRGVWNAWAATPVIKAWFDAVNSFELLHYYDLPLVEYIAYSRTQDPFFLGLARKCADSWASHPNWIGDGKIRLWPDNAAPPPRHAGLGGLMLRALDGREDLWDWLNSYTDYFNEIYVNRNVIANAPMRTNPREAAFSMHGAAWLAKVLPDSFPASTGRRTDGAALRAAYVTDLEAAVKYYGSKQRVDGAWVWDDDFIDTDGGLLKGVTQPFIVGLLLAALCDVYEVVGDSVKEIVKTQILKGCRYLYEGGPYIKDEIEQRSGKRIRGFHYFCNGGTSVNPTKYEKGDMQFPWTDLEGWWLASARQPISTILPAYGWAYKVSGDEFYKLAGEELWDAAYSGRDGFRAMMDDTAKNFNQHARRGGSYRAWLGSEVSAPSLPEPIPTPAPTPSPAPAPAPAPPTGPTPVITITSPANGATLSGRATVIVSVTDTTGITEMYLIAGGLVATGGEVAESFSFDTTKLADGSYFLLVRAWKGDTPIDSKTVSVVVKNAVTEPPPPPPVDPPPVDPPPVPIPPTPSPKPTCTITVPEQLALPPNFSGVLTVAVVADVSLLPFQVSATAIDGQVTVTPSSQRVDRPSMLLAFSVRTKKRSSSVRFNSPCGQKVTRIVVR